VFFDDNGEVNGGKVAYGQGKHSGSATFEQEDGTTTVGANYNYGRNGASGTVSVSDEEVSGQVSIKAGPVGVTGGGSVTTDKAGTEVIGGNPTYDAMQGQTAELVTNTNGYDWNAGVSATAYGLTASMGYGQNSSNTDAYGNYLLSGDELQARQDQLVMGPMSVDELQTGDIIKSTDREGDQLTGGVNFLGLVGVNGSSSDQNRQTSTMVVHDDQIAVDIGEGDTHSGSVTWRSKDIS